VGPATVGVVAFYSPEFTGKTGDAVYVEANASVPIPGAEGLSASGAIGHQEIDLAPSYTTWNAGLSYALGDHIVLDVRYWDTDSHELGSIYDSRFVGTVKAVF
jgi:uncharacterized protein (TIGR02001 family)